MGYSEDQFHKDVVKKLDHIAKGIERLARPVPKWTDYYFDPGVVARKPYSKADEIAEASSEMLGNEKEKWTDEEQYAIIRILSWLKEDYGRVEKIKTIGDEFYVLFDSGKLIVYFENLEIASIVVIKNQDVRLEVFGSQE